MFAASFEMPDVCATSARLLMNDKIVGMSSRSASSAAATAAAKRWMRRFRISAAVRAAMS